MLKVSVFELFARLIPEALIFMFAIYTFSKVRVEKKKYLIASSMLGISVFFVRLLPINYGVHTILNIIMVTVIANSINKINMIKAIKASIIITVLLFIIEAISVIILNSIFREQLQVIFSNPTLKIIFGLPSLIFFGIIVGGYYIYLNKRNKLIYV